MRIFICVGFLIGASGTIYLHRTLGGKGIWPYFVFLFLINDILAFGFLSFVFSNGLVAWVFAFWIKSKEMNVWAKLCLFTVATMLLLTAHLFAFCVYALLVGSYEIAAFIERYKDKNTLFSNNFIIGAAQFIPSFILFFLTRTVSSGVPFSAGSIMAKLSGLASLISLYFIELQLIVIALIGIFIVFMLIKKKAQIASRMYVFIILSFVFFIIAPGDAFGSFFLDRRMPIAFLFPLIASIQFKPVKINYSLCWGALVAVCLSQYAYVGYKWTIFDRQYNDLYVAAKDLEAGDKLLHFNMEKDSFSDNFAPPVIRFPEHLMLTKGVISPYVFADPRHQPISYHGPIAKGAAEYPSIPQYDEERIEKLRIALDAELYLDYDYLLLTDFDKDFLAASKWWQPYAEEGIFKIYKKMDLSKVTP